MPFKVCERSVKQIVWVFFLYSSTIRMSSQEENPPCPAPDMHFIGKKADIVKAGRVTMRVNGCRDVLVVYHQEKLYALDLRCYRKL